MAENELTRRHAAMGKFWKRRTDSGEQASRKGRKRRNERTGCIRRIPRGWVRYP
jgi:hypothetical protein